MKNPLAEDKLAALRSIAPELAQAQDPRQLLHLLVARSLTVTGAERGGVVLVGEDGELHLEYGLRLAPSEGAMLSQTVVRRVLAEGCTRAWLDVAVDEEIAGAGSVRGQGLQAVLCAPLPAGAELRGALYLDSRHHPAGGFAEADIAIVEMLAACAVMALRWAQETTDALTGAENRVRFVACLEEALRIGGTVALLLADVTGLHEINETFGYQAGDEAIRLVAQMMQSTLFVTVFRLGGDEFGSILTGRDRAAAARFRQNMFELAPHVSETEPWRGFGVGIAIGPDDGTTVRDLYTAADDDLRVQRGRPRRKVPGIR